MKRPGDDGYDFPCGFPEETGPKIPWIKNDPTKYNCFTDGSEFLVALQVNNNKTGITKWEYDVVQFDCDGEEAHLEYRSGELYDAWTWNDFEYFILLDGDMPTFDEEYK